jgi:hypothetical protein
VPPDTVLSIPDPGTSLAVPVDGRLRGYRFAGEILGVATGTRLGTGSSAQAAPAGQRLWVFGIRWLADTDSNADPQSVTSTLVVDGTRIAFPASQDSPNAGEGSHADSTWDSGPTYWLASVPANAADVAVELASAGYPQTFSLTKMSREGPQPTVLYRDPTTWQVAQPLSEEHDLPTPDTTDALPGASLPLSLSGITLSWFGPGGPNDTPADPAEAWLVPNLSSQSTDTAPPHLNYLQPLSASDMTLKVAGEPPIRPTVFPGLGPDQNGIGVFTGEYAFKVPSGLNAATLIVTPGALAAQADLGGGLGSDLTVDVAGSAVFNLSVPAPAPWTPPPGASTVPGPIRNLASSSSAAAGRTGSGSSSVLTPLLILLAVVVAATAGVLLARRRHRNPAIDAGDTGRPAAPAESMTSPIGTPPPQRSDPPPSSSTLERSPREPSPPVLLVPPEEPPPLPEGVVEPQVLGPLRLIGWPDGAPPPGPTILELLTFLALHPGERFSAEQLRSAIGRGRDRDVEVATIRRYMNDLRRVLGDRIPEARSAGGYEVLGVSADANRFTAAIELAKKATSPIDEACHLANALSLVRGAPFEDHPPGTYGWAETGANLSATLANSARTAAARLAGLAIDAGDSDLEAWAARRGLLV